MNNTKANWTLIKGYIPLLLAYVCKSARLADKASDLEKSTRY